MIKYLVQEKVDEKGSIGIIWREPNTKLFNSETEAREYEENYIKERQEYLNTLSEKQRSTWVETVDYKILEKEVKDSIVIEGIVGDNGQTGEDYCTLVDDKNIDSIMGRYYKGNNIKITIEVIE